MSVVLDLKKPVEHLSSTQKTFHRLQKKVDSLNKQLERITQELDWAANYYLENILPSENKLSSSLREVILALYNHANTIKKVDQRAFIFLINKYCNQYLKTFTGANDSEINNIYKELTGGDLHEELAQDFELLKKEMQTFFKSEVNVDLDLSTLDFKDSEQEIMSKLADSFSGLKDQFDIPAPEKPKTKKQILKEERAETLERLQSKGINVLYKELAKVFHPDLEPNPLRKREKEALMKQLTAAYENKDLLTLLALEKKCFGNLQNQKDEAEVKIFNSILKDQIELLETMIEMVFLQPCYFSIQVYYEQNISIGHSNIIKHYESNIKDTKNYNDIVIKLKCPNNHRFLKKILDEAFIEMCIQAAYEDFNMRG